MRNIKLAFAVALAVAALLLNSCTSDRSGDVKELLGVVPSDVSFVATIDLEDVLREVGCKVKDGEVKPGKEIAQALDGNPNREVEFLFDLFVNGGVNPSYVVLYGEGYNVYLAGFISNTNLFKERVESYFKEASVNEDGLTICGNIAYDTNRFWICASSRNTISVKDVKHFSDLSKNQSFLSKSEAADLVESEKTISAWGDVKGCLNAFGLDFTTKAAIQMGLEAMFKDAVAFKLEADFESDGLDAEFMFVNSKNGVAKFLYPTAKVDKKMIKESGLSGQLFAALAFSPKIAEQLKEDTKGKGFSVLGVVSGIITAVDGTIMLASDNGTYSGIIPVNGNNTVDLEQLLKQYGLEVVKEKDKLVFNNGKVSGGVNSELASDLLEGSMGGVVLSMQKESLPYEYVSFSLNPEKGGMVVEMDLKAKENESVLINLLKGN